MKRHPWIYARLLTLLPLLLLAGPAVAAPSKPLPKTDVTTQNPSDSVTPAQSDDDDSLDDDEEDDDEEEALD